MKEISDAIALGNKDPSSTPKDELKKLIRKRRLDAEKKELEAKSKKLGVSVGKLLEMEAAEKGFCLGDVEVKISLDGGVAAADESVWLSPSTSLAPTVPISGPPPPKVGAATQYASGDSAADSLLRSVLDLQHQGQTSTAPWVEEWSMGARLDQADVKKRDHDGEELIHSLSQLLRKSGDQFTDSSFPPTDASLYGSGNSGGEFLSGLGGIEWKRSGEIGQHDREAVVFSDDLDPDDVAQGKLGDCYFLAALASCASAADDHLLKDLIIEEGHDVGLYGVKFFVSGHWVTVVVDDLFPCTADENGEWQPIFAHSKVHGAVDSLLQLQLWVMIFEKAWAKLHGSFQAIEGECEILPF